MGLCEAAHATFTNFIEVKSFHACVKLHGKKGERSLYSQQQQQTWVMLGVRRDVEPCGDLLSSPGRAVGRKLQFDSLLGHKTTATDASKADWVSVNQEQWFLCTSLGWLEAKQESGEKCFRNCKYSAQWGQMNECMK